MGSYSELWFSDFHIGSTKSYLDEWLFKNSEKKISTGKILPHEREEDFLNDDDNEPSKRYYFESTVENIIKRLEIRGYTLDSAKRDLRNTINDWLKYVREIIKDGFGPDKEIYNLIKKNRDLKNWIDAYKIIYDEKINTNHGYNNNEFHHENELVSFIMNNSDAYTEEEFIWLNYPSQDFNMFARVVLSVLDPNDLVILDATDLVYGGYYQGFEIIEDTQGENTIFFEKLSTEIHQIVTMVKRKKNKEDESVLAKLFYSNIITLMEAYLSETLIYTVLSFQPLLRRLIESDPEFKKRKFDYAELFITIDDINDNIRDYLQSIMYHNISKVRELYRSVLYVDFPRDMTDIFKSIQTRHDLIHRNGKTLDDLTITIKYKDVIELSDNILTFIKAIDLQVKNVYPSMLALTD